jgi:hypothetical protein
MYTLKYIQTYSQKFDNERTIIATEILAGLIKYNQDQYHQIVKQRHDLSVARAEIGNLRRRIRVLTGAINDDSGPSPRQAN